MTNDRDELMRLAERVEALALSCDVYVPGATTIAADLRALAQRAPQNGAVPDALRPAGFNESAHVTVMTYTTQPGNVEAWRLGEACARAKPGGDYIDGGLSLLRELHARGYGIVRVHPLAAAPAAEDSAEAAGTARHHEEVMSSDPGRPAEDDAVDRGEVVEPSPRQSPDAGKMVGETVLDREYVERTRAKSRNWQGQISVNASALAELCRVYLAQLNTPEAERAEGEAVCADCGWSGQWPNSDAGRRGSCPACEDGALVQPSPAPPPAGQPEGDKPTPGTYWRDPKTGRLWSEVDVRFEGKNTIDWERVVVGGQPEGVDDYERIYAEVIQVCADQLMAHEIASRLASAQQAGKDGGGE